ncbi:MAG: hypothetical protein ACLQFW_03970 [Xanthobacteraceae bacterium]
MAEKASYFSRFFYKLLEIMGAAVATAVSGYLVAHLGGFLPPRTQAPTPAAVSAAPSDHGASKNIPASVPANRPAAPFQSATAPASMAPASMAPASMAPASTATASPEAGDQRVAQPQDTTGSATSSSRKSAKAAAAPARKRGKADTAATESNKPRETQHEIQDAKPREGEDQESVEARVRAALANVDANRPASNDVPPRRGDIQGAAGATVQPRPIDVSPSTAGAVQPRPVDLPPASVGAGSPPRSADLAPSAQPTSIQPAAIQPAGIQPSAVQSAPVQQPDALTTVEIKSRPVANIDPTPAAEPEAPAPEEKGVLSALKHILPDFRRAAAPDEAPRPPAPVGE